MMTNSHVPIVKIDQDNLHDSAILIVDDEKDIRSIVKKILRPHIARFFEAGNGLDAIDILSEEKIDLAIIDLKMPRMGGIELLKQINSNYSNVVPIILTAFGDKESAICAIQNNAYDFLEKPINSGILVHRINKAIELAKNRSLLRAAAKEYAMQFLEKNIASKFDSLPIQEQNKILSAALGLIKLKQNPARKKTG
ncbi:MAG: response regulator [Oligoflexia bacterium]|nr:response regulator [Oligoflexia bacterium]